MVKTQQPKSDSPPLEAGRTRAPVRVRVSALLDGATEAILEHDGQDYHLRGFLMATSIKPVPRTTPMLGVAGWSNSGKTTLIEKLTKHFSDCGLRVATIKHTHHKFDIDTHACPIHCRGPASRNDSFCRRPERLEVRNPATPGRDRQRLAAAHGRLIPHRRSRPAAPATPGR